MRDSLGTSCGPRSCGRAPVGAGPAHTGPCDRPRAAHGRSTLRRRSGTRRPERRSGEDRRSLLLSRRGTAATEFAIILPILLLFLFGIITFASTLFVHSNMLNAAREAARQMSVAEASHTPGGGVTCSQPEAAIDGSAEKTACAYLVTWGTGFVVEATDFCPAAREVEVRISTDASNVALLDIFGFFEGRTLAAEVNMRREQACA